MAKSRVPVISRVGGKWASTVVETPGNTIGSFGSTSLKYGKSNADSGFSVKGCPPRIGATNAESPLTSTTDPQKVPIAPGFAKPLARNAATDSAVKIPPAEQP